MSGSSMVAASTGRSFTPSISTTSEDAEARDGDEQEMQLMREEELQNAVEGLATWQTQRNADIEKQLGDLAERHVSAIAQLRRSLAVDLAKATAENERRLGELKRSHSTQPMPTEDWLRGTLLARQADEVTTVVGERAPVLRALQQGYERQLVALDTAKACEDRRLHRRKLAVEGVTGQMQAMQSQLLAALARSADAERKAAGWHAESERQAHLLREAMLLQRQREEDDRVERASRERYDMERVQALEAATKAAAAAKALAAEERAAREKLEEDLRAKPPRRFLTPCGSRAATASPASKQSPRTPSSGDRGPATAQRTLFESAPSSGGFSSLTLGGGNSQPLKENNATSFRLAMRGGGGASKPKLTKADGSMTLQAQW